MPNVCSVAVCRVLSCVSKVQFHKFSKNTYFQNLWIDKYGRRDDFNQKRGRVYETLFFNEDYFETKTSGQKKLKPNATPGKNLTKENQGKMSSTSSKNKAKKSNRLGNYTN